MVQLRGKFLFWESLLLQKYRRVISAGIILGFCAYPYVNTDTKFQFQPTEFNKAVVARSDQHLNRYMPGLGISGKVRQILFNVWFAKDKDAPICYERHLLTMADGGTISIDWATAEQNPTQLVEPTLQLEDSGQTRKKRVCVIFPGLSAGSGRGYVKALAKTLMSDGFEVAVFHNRGVENTPYTSMRFTDLSRTEELERTIQFVRDKAGPEADLVGVGLSLGANTVMKIAGEQGASFPLRAIATVNNPFDTWLAINLMRGNQYEKSLVKELIKQQITREPWDLSPEQTTQMQAMYKHFNLDIEKIRQADSWRVYDEEFTAKVLDKSKFKSVIQYYNACSCLDWVDKVQVPTLVLHSQDDPIVPVDCLPHDECLANPHIITALTRRGSHVCYFMHKGTRRWYTRACSEFLQNSLQLLEQNQRRQ